MKNNKIYIKFGFLLIIILISYFGYNSWKYSSVTKIVEENIKTTNNIKEAYFAGGCFWCTELSFEKYKENGIIDVISGYAGGNIENPTYKQVGKGTTGHKEAVKVIYDADTVSYNDLLEIFWRTVNPTDNEGQYVDRGFQYTSAIFYLNNEEKELAINSINKLQESGRYGDKELITPITEFTNFYDAEEYHQDFYIKNPVRYNVYTNGSGRKEYLEGIWGDDLHYNFNGKNINKDIRFNYKGEKLTDIQYRVTQKAGTERPFDNEYWDNKKQGIYVDIIDGTPLFSSTTKYESGTGWPSFTKPISLDNVVEREDNTIFSKRLEITGAKSKAHIGHIIYDGPEDNGFIRYCMNSAALIFISKENLEKEGYGKYLDLFIN
ncbi:MAG: peptide-methionine (S)-S-oxide reductase MsrA [Candidatus Gracilibacteria bacterium]